MDIIDYSSPDKDTVRQAHYALETKGLVWDEGETPFIEIYLPYTADVSLLQLGNNFKIHVLGYAYRKK